MIYYYITDDDAANRNSAGYFIMKQPDGSTVFCCPEYQVCTRSLDLVMKPGSSPYDPGDWFNWEQRLGLRPATADEVRGAGLEAIVTGRHDSDAMVYASQFP
jgi:hypothetical protein